MFDEGYYSGLLPTGALVQGEAEGLDRPLCSGSRDGMGTLRVV